MGIIRRIIGTLIVAAGGAVAWPGGSHHPQETSMIISGCVLVALGSVLG